ncbi:MAG: ABC transporter substrate-binding protein [Anaerolineae bacterium]|nr:ABC transporter substrate-binding protein [Anaerolineae bacterium]
MSIKTITSEMLMTWFVQLSLQRLHRLRAVGLLLCIMLVAAGCGLPANPTIIKIGLVAPFEGAYRDVGYDAIYAARLAVREINTYNAPLGWAIELVAYDDRAEQEMAITSARNLVVDPEVVAVIGHYLPETTFAASDIYASADLSMLVIGDGPQAPGIWHLAPDPQEYSDRLLDTIGSSIENTAVWGEGAMAFEIRQQLSQRASIIVDSDSTTVSILPDTIFSTLSPLQTAEYLDIWSQAGWKGQLVGTSSLHTTSFEAVSGQAVTGVCYITPYPLPGDVANISSWVEAYTSTDPHAPAPGPYALATYEAVYILAKTISDNLEPHSSLTRQEFNAALANTRRTSHLGEIFWNAQGYWNAAPLYHYCWQQKPVLMGILN